jgi:hypothetical protein
LDFNIINGTGYLHPDAAWNAVALIALLSATHAAMYSLK